MLYNYINEEYFINETSHDYENFLLKPKNDFVFKKIFGDNRNKDLLIALLNSILTDKISDVTIVNSELLKSHVEDKKGILDVRAVTDLGYNIDVEIQVLRILAMPERSLFYWSKLYGEQILKGEKYTKLKKTITINIVDFDCFNTNNYHSVFHLWEDNKSFILTNVMEIHFLELTKLNAVVNNDNLMQWMNFIKSDSKEVIEEMAKVNPDIQKAFDILTTISEDRETRALYLSREMALHDEASRLEEAIEEGKLEGRTEILIKQLKRKLGNLPTDIEGNLKNLSEDKLDDLAVNIFEIETINDINKYLP